MRLVRLAGVVTFTVLSLPLPVAAQSFAPSGPWEISADADSCILKRDFGEGENALSLEIQRYFPGDYRAVITSNTLVPTKSIKIRYRVNEDEAWREDIAKYNSRVAEGSKVVFFPWALLLPQVHSGMTSPEIAEFFESEDVRSQERAGGAEIKTLTVEGAYENPTTLRLGSMASPIDAMNDCFDDLLTIWGIDAEGEKTLTRRARPTASTKEKIYDPIGYLVNSAKPSDLTIRLIISASGEIESCHFDKLKSPQAAIDSFCRQYRRKIDFEPALDANGNGVRSHYVFRYINPNE